MATQTKRVVLVTGGAGGLGKAIATAFLASGAAVVVSDINDALLSSLSAEPEFSVAGNEDRFLALNADVTREESAKELFGKIVEKFGRLDVLVNNAGIMDRFEAVDECSPELWNKVLAVNLTGPFIMTRLAISHFLSQSIKGKILNIGSLASFRGGMAGAAYTASKHGLLGLTRNTAASYMSNGISCNILMPGGMNTNISSAFAQGLNIERCTKVQTVMGVVGAGVPGLNPLESVAANAVFLCSSENGLNGAEIVNDGGLCSY